MAEKRAATSELNRQNWNKEETSETSGKFQTASADEIKNRVIKKARRKITSENEENKSVFSGFSGFKSTTPSMTSTSSPFSFLKTNATTSSLSDKCNNDKKEDSLIKNNTVENGSHTTCKDYSKLKGLNEALVDWIKQNVEENPICILTPIFKDYENYLKEIITDEKETSSENDNSSQEKKDSEKTKSDQPKMFSFLNKDNKSEANPLESTTSPVKSFSFGQANNKTPPNESGSSTTSNIFANIKPPTSTNIFGNAGGFQPKASDISGQNKTFPTTGFSFNNSKPFSFGGSVASQNSATAEDVKPGNAEDEESEEPPKNDFKTVVEEDSVYSKRCKVFVKHDGIYTDRGVGTLYLKTIKDSDKFQLLVRADTNLGNILLNFILSEGLPSQRMGKNNVMIVCIPTPESEQKPTSVLLRVKNGEEADELLETIDKHKK